MSTRGMDGKKAPARVGRWPFGLALAAALCAVPLVIFGGSVTTLGAGMAVEGWLVAEGHFLLFFPIESWFRDTATFVEHTHRLFGVAVGLCAIGCVLATWRREDRRAAKVLAFGALVAICVQGAIGGFRVLEASPNLAFVHGALAQAVFALLCANAVFLSRTWRSRASARSDGRQGPWLLAGLAVLTVYAQVVLGAVYRHGLRSEANDGVQGLFVLHLLGAVVAMIVVTVLATRLAHQSRGAGAGPLARAPQRFATLMGVQVSLGLISWVGYRPDGVGPAEWFVSVAHVLVGGFLLAECVRTAMWSWRGTRVKGLEAAVPAPHAGWGAAR